MVVCLQALDGVAVGWLSVSTLHDGESDRRCQPACGCAGIRVVQVAGLPRFLASWLTGFLADWLPGGGMACCLAALLLVCLGCLGWPVGGLAWRLACSCGDSPAAVCRGHPRKKKPGQRPGLGRLMPGTGCSVCSAPCAQRVQALAPARAGMLNSPCLRMTTCLLSSTSTTALSPSPIRPERNSSARESSSRRITARRSGRAP